MRKSLRSTLHPSLLRANQLRCSQKSLVYIDLNSANTTALVTRAPSKERRPDSNHASKVFENASFKQKTPSFLDSSRTIIQPAANLKKPKNLAACKENIANAKPQ